MEKSKQKLVIANIFIYIHIYKNGLKAKMMAQNNLVNKIDLLFKTLNMQYYEIKSIMNYVNERKENKIIS